MANVNHLTLLESESIYILREVAAQCERPVLLYSVGKDSSVLVRLAQKAFYPGKIPFPLLHIDTGYKFPEMYEFRDRFTSSIGAQLIVDQNEKARAENANPYDLGTERCCGLLKTQALLTALERRMFDAAIGGARRDEEKSRAKERIFSFRDHLGQWHPRNQRPELWNLYNGKVKKGDSIRVFPLSNWTELDVWNYILSEDIPVVPLYFAQMRRVIVRGAQLIPVSVDEVPPLGQTIVERMCRFRTLGCMPCTGAIPSEATNVEAVITELSGTQMSERVNRLIDYDREGSMEQKKREGYF